MEKKTVVFAEKRKHPAGGRKTAASAGMHFRFYLRRL